MEMTVQEQIEVARSRCEIRTMIIDALLIDHERKDGEIACELGMGVTGSRVRGIRSVLELSGRIPKWRPSKWCPPKQRSIDQKTRQYHRLDLPDFFTYIIESEKCGKLKVGRSKDVVERVKCLQSHSPDKLRIFATIPNGRWEKVLHDRLDDYHSYGEWFEHNDQVMSIISDVIREAESIPRS